MGWKVPQRQRTVCEGRQQRGVGWGGRRVAWPGSEGLGGGRAPSSGEAGTVHSGLRQTWALRRWCRRALGWDTKSTCVPICFWWEGSCAPGNPWGGPGPFTDTDPLDSDLIFLGEGGQEAASPLSLGAEIGECTGSCRAHGAPISTRALGVPRAWQSCGPGRPCREGFVAVSLGRGRLASALSACLSPDH